MGSCHISVSPSEQRSPLSCANHPVRPCPAPACARASLSPRTRLRLFLLTFTYETNMARLARAAPKAAWSSRQKAASSSKEEDHQKQFASESEASDLSEGDSGSEYMPDSEPETEDKFEEYKFEVTSCRRLRRCSGH